MSFASRTFLSSKIATSEQIAWEKCAAFIALEVFFLGILSHWRFSLWWPKQLITRLSLRSYLRYQAVCRIGDFLSLVTKTTQYSIIIKFIFTISGILYHWRFSLSGGQNNPILDYHYVHIYDFRHFVPLEVFSSLVPKTTDYSIITAFILTFSGLSHQRFSFSGAPNNRLLIGGFFSLVPKTTRLSLRS